MKKEERPKELHGFGSRAWLRKVAKHEAGHALMLWLLDQYLTGIYITEEGGITVRLDFAGREMKLPSQHLLYTLAGMVFTYDIDIIDDLRAHIDTPDYFNPETDSYVATMLVKCFTGNPVSVLYITTLWLPGFDSVSAGNSMNCLTCS